MPGEEFYQVHTTNLNRPPTVSTLTPRKPLNSPPSGRPPSRRSPGPIYLPANIYKLLSDVAIKELKRYNATTRSTPPPKRAVNTHDTDPQPEQNPTDSPTGDPNPPASPVDSDLDNTEPCEAFTFDDSTLEHLMDAYPPSYSVNKTHIYHVSKHSSSLYGSLIDMGANAALAGSDVRILERTGRTVSVTGIGNHELPGLDIVTCAALLHTNHGKVILIMHKYAYYGRGNTIHSPGQIEWFQNTCDDKSFHVGRKQVITFLDGYATPLQCRTGLMYMNLLGEPTDADLDTFPHVLLTGSHEWDPSVLGYTNPATAGTPPGPEIPPNTGHMTPGLMNLAILRGEFTTLSLIPLATPTLLNTNMLSKLNPLILKSSGPILAGSTNIPLRKPSTKPLNVLLPPLVFILPGICPQLRTRIFPFVLS